MKKLLAVALVLCILVPCAVAEAPVDVKSMSDADLKALYIAVAREVTERKIWEESILPAGIYRVEKPLPEGTYSCIMKTTKDIGFVWIYRNNEDYKNNNKPSLLSLKNGEEFTLSLFDDVVYVIDSPAIVRPFVGFDW